MHVFKRRAKRARALQKLRADIRVWAGVGAKVTFRAEVMPGRDRVERTFTVARVVASGRVELTGLAGEHAETEFESEKSAALIDIERNLKVAKAGRSSSKSAKN